MIEKLIEYDTELFVYLNSLGNESWDTFWIIVSEKWSSIPIYAILLWLIIKKYKWKGTLIILICVALMIMCTDQLANVFKDGFKRLRPCQLFELKERMRMVADYCGRYGYFSAHAASSMAAAFFLGLSLKPWYKWLFWILLVWAMVVAYSRVYLGVHYPLDILSGMFFGGWIGYLFYKIQMWLQRKFNAWILHTNPGTDGL